MWTCPKCGREFKKTNQGHYCGKAPETVDEYIASQETEMQAHLRLLRNIILENISEVIERIAWSMPTYKKDGKSVSFVACKKHVSLYIDTEVLESFKSDLSKFEIKKNAVYLPYTKDIPADLISDMIKQCFETI